MSTHGLCGYFGILGHYQHTIKDRTYETIQGSWLHCFHHETILNLKVSHEGGTDPGRLARALNRRIRKWSDNENFWG
jgi:hypothetical protein